MADRNQLVEVIEDLYSITAQQQQKWAKASAVTPKALDTWQVMRQTMRNGMAQTFEARSTIQRVLDDDSLPAAHRLRLIRKAQADARAAIQNESDQLQVGVQLMEQELATAALPKPPRDPRAVANARDLLKLQIAGGRDADSVLAAAARRGDDVAAVAVGEYGHALLGASGAPDPDSAHGMVRRMAVMAAAERGNAAAQTFMQLDDLKKLAVAAPGSNKLVMDQTDSLVNNAVSSGQLS